MPERHDVAVVGLGVIGAACAAMIAETGARVIAFDRFEPPHDRGSSHGETRIFRIAYAEGAQYAPLAQRALALWRALEADAPGSLLRQTGLIYAGAPDGPLLHGVRDSAQTHGLALRLAEPAEISFATSSSWDVIVEPDAGYLRAEACVAGLMAKARQNGAALRLNAQARFERADRGFKVSDGAHDFYADRLVLCVGGWLAAYLNNAAGVALRRHSLHWFAHDDAMAFTPFIAALHDASWIYALPGVDGASIKVANHFGGQALAAPEERDAVDAMAILQSFEPEVRALMPDIGAHRQSKNCLYTMTPDEDFLIGPHPNDDAMFIAGGMSGHGFKFAPAIGELAAQWLTGDETVIDPAMFSPSRLFT